MSSLISAILILILIGFSELSGQGVVREFLTSKVNITDIKLLDSTGRILAVADTRTPLLSRDGGATFQRVLSDEEQLRFGNKAITATDGKGNGIISGGVSSWLLYLTSDAGETWREVEYQRVAREEWISLSSDGNARLGGLVSADAGLTWRQVVIPDSIENSHSSEWYVGYSFGRGSLIRPPNASIWYQVDHKTGRLQERADIMPQMTFVGELASGALILGSNDQGKNRVTICLPGKGCTGIDSVSESSSLSAYEIREVVHFDHHVVLTFTNAPFCVVLNDSGYRILDIRTYIPGAKSVLNCTLDRTGVVLRTTGYRVFVPHVGDSAIHARTLVSSSLNDILSDSNHYGIVERHGLVATNFADGSVVRRGLIVDVDGEAEERLAFRDVIPLIDGVYCVSYDGNVHRIDAKRRAPFEWRMGAFSVVNDKPISTMETAAAAFRRFEALNGCSRFWGISRGLTASGSVRGLRLERHDVDSSSIHRNDTISLLVVPKESSNVIVGHRDLWSSGDTARTWLPVTLPSLGSTVSAYATYGASSLVGYRGFRNTVNDVEVGPTPGGLYIKDNQRDWTKVDAIPGNYVYNLSIDLEGSIWVVSTTAELLFHVDESGEEKDTLAIDVLQGDIDIHRSSDDGKTWSLEHHVQSSGYFNPITGVVSQGRYGHVVALPSILLFRPNGSDTFEPLKLLPFNSILYSARFDMDGHIWVAASDGVYMIELSNINSVAISNGFTSSVLSVSPNPIPSGTNAQVDCLECSEFEKFDLFDTMGNHVKSFESRYLSTTGLHSGMYVLRCSSGQIARLVVF